MNLGRWTTDAYLNALPRAQLILLIFVRRYRFLSGGMIHLKQLLTPRSFPQSTPTANVTLHSSLTVVRHLLLGLPGLFPFRIVIKPTGGTAIRDGPPGGRQNLPHLPPQLKVTAHISCRPTSP